MNHSGPVMRFTRILSHALIVLVPFAALCLITIAYSRGLGLTNDLEPLFLADSRTGKILAED